MKRCCENCLFADVCVDEGVCDNYSPIEYSDVDIERDIEEGRNDFRREFFEYISPF